MLPIRLLKSRATIMRPVPIPDGYGGTQSLDTGDPADGTEIAVGVPCRVGSPSTRQKFTAEVKTKNADVDIVVVFMNYRDDVLERDRLLIENTAGSGDFTNYDVQNVKDPGLAHHHLEITVQVIK